MLDLGGDAGHAQSLLVHRLERGGGEARRALSKFDCETICLSTLKTNNSGFQLSKQRCAALNNTHAGTPLRASIDARRIISDEPRSFASPAHRSSPYSTSNSVRCSVSYGPRLSLRPSLAASRHAEAFSLSLCHETSRKRREIREAA